LVTLSTISTFTSNEYESDESDGSNRLAITESDDENEEISPKIETMECEPSSSTDVLSAENPSNGSSYIMTSTPVKDIDAEKMSTGGSHSLQSVNLKTASPVAKQIRTLNDLRFTRYSTSSTCRPRTLQHSGRIEKKLTKNSNNSSSSINTIVTHQPAPTRDHQVRNLRYSQRFCQPTMFIFS